MNRYANAAQGCWSKLRSDWRRRRKRSFKRDVWVAERDLFLAMSRIG